METSEAVVEGLINSLDFFFMTDRLIFWTCDLYIIDRDIVDSLLKYIILEVPLFTSPHVDIIEVFWWSKQLPLQSRHQHCDLIYQNMECLILFSDVFGRLVKNGTYGIRQTYYKL